MSHRAILTFHLGPDTFVLGPGLTRVAERGAAPSRPALLSKNELRPVLYRLVGDPYHATRLRQGLATWRGWGERVDGQRDGDLVTAIMDFAATGAVTGILSVGTPAPQSVAAYTSGDQVDIARMSVAERAEATFARMPDHLQGTVGAEFESMVTPEARRTMAGVFAVWAAGHAFGISEVIDVFLLVGGVVLFGFQIRDIALNIAEAVSIIADATTEQEIDEAAELIAAVVAAIGVATFVAMVTHAVAKGGRGTYEAKPKSLREPPPPKKPPPEDRIVERPQSKDEAPRPPPKEPATAKSPPSPAEQAKTRQKSAVEASGLCQICQG